MTKGVKNAPKRRKPKPLVEKIDDAEAGRGAVAQGHREEGDQGRRRQKTPEPASRLAQARSDRREAQEAGRSRRQAKAEPKPLPPKKPEQASSRNSTPTRSRRCSTSAIRSATPRPARSSIRRRRSAPRRGSAAQLSQSEIDALRARLMALWNPPVGAQDADNSRSCIRIRFKRDGTLARPAGSDQRQRRAVSTRCATAPCARC